jgi:hypothetical protein
MKKTLKYILEGIGEPRSFFITLLACMATHIQIGNQVMLDFNGRVSLGFWIIFSGNWLAYYLADFIISAINEILKERKAKREAAA